MPARARRDIVEEGSVGIYHCVHRCVRRAYLCGFDQLTGRSFEHRKDWIQQRFQELSTIFAVEVCGYAVMATHVHSILRLRPDTGATWTAEELARRWWRLFPKRRDASGRPEEPEPSDLERILDYRGGGQRRIDELRERLTSLSWFMRCFAVYIARRANREDECTGRFWEGRFKSQRLADEAAVLACSVYVDLNPIRAGVAETPEASSHTSVQDRVRARQAHEKRAQATERGVALPAKERARLTAAERSASFLVPLGEAESHLPRTSTEEYLAIVDWTGRQVVQGKRGAIPDALAPILERLQLDVDHWLEAATTIARRFSHLIGSVAALGAEVARTGQAWIQGAPAARRLFSAGA